MSNAERIIKPTRFMLVGFFDVGFFDGFDQIHDRFRFDASATAFPFWTNRIRVIVTRVGESEIANDFLCNDLFSKRLKEPAF